MDVRQTEPNRLATILDVMEDPEAAEPIRKRALEILREEVAHGRIGSIDARTWTYLLRLSHEKLTEELRRSSLDRVAALHADLLSRALPDKYRSMQND